MVLSRSSIIFRNLAAAAAAVAALSACSPLKALNAVTPNGSYKLTEDVAYGPDERHRLDVYRPTRAGAPKRVVVFLYGGSWKRGDRSSYRFVGEALSAEGYVAVLPDYRTYPAVRFPGFNEDAAAAVRWVHDNIANHGGDPNQIYLMGHSAGAHIAAMLTLDERYLGQAGVPAGTVRGMIGLAGPYSFDPLKYKSVRAVFEGIDNSDEARPIAFVDGSEPAMLLLHGTEDGTVYPRNSEQLSKRVAEAGGTARYVGYPDVGHIGIMLALSRPFRGRATVLEDTVAFIEAQ